MTKRTRARHGHLAFCHFFWEELERQLGHMPRIGWNVATEGDIGTQQYPLRVFLLEEIYAPDRTGPVFDGHLMEDERGTAWIFTRLAGHQWWRF